MSICTYIINGDTLAAEPAAFGANSYLFVCPECGDFWAAVRIPAREYFPLRAPCIKHEWCERVPGSILAELPARWTGPMAYNLTLEGVPSAILARELLLHLNHYEKGIENEHSTTLEN